MDTRTTALILACLALLVQSAAGQTVLLDFTSPHCEPCQHMVPVIGQLATAGYPVRKVDITREPALAQKFNIARVPCFVMIADGREVDRFVGLTSYSQLEQMLTRAGATITPSRTRTQSPDSALPANPWASASAPPTTYASETAATDVAPVVSQTIQKEEQPLFGGARKRLRDFLPLGRQQAPPKEPGGPPAWNALIDSTVRLRVDDGGGLNSRGTGTIIDERSGEALIVTCGHIFRDSEGRGPVSVELFENTASGPRVVAELPGQVVGYDLDRDLGLISIRTNRPARVARIASSPENIQRGDRVASLGCNGGENPTLESTRVTAIDRYQGPPNIEASGAPVEGRSGGGLFNDRGELIGVCFAADTEGNEGLYVGLPAIHAVLDGLNLGQLYGAPAKPPVADQVAQATYNEPVVRGQEPMQGMEPVAFAQETASTTLEVESPSPSPSPSLLGRGQGRVSDSQEQVAQALSPTEQAAMEELMARAAESEVVCIIRPKKPGGKSEIITLDSVSPEFIRGLAEARRTTRGTDNR